MTAIWTSDAVTTLARSVLDAEDHEVAAAMRARVHTVLRVLLPADADVPGQAAELEILLTALERVLHPADAEKMWLILAVLSARLPQQSGVEDALRSARLDGPLAVVAEALKATVASQDGKPYVDVEVIRGEVLVDLHHTSQASFATGIQRVARETASRWRRDHPIVPVGWTELFDGLHRLPAAQEKRALWGSGDTAPPETILTGTKADTHLDSVIVPWECSYLVPELLAEPERTRAFQSIVRHSRSTVGMLGFDCVPLTTAETTADGMGGAFAMMLSAATYASRLAAISHGAAREYRGWTAMLAGTGLPGPAIAAISLPVQAHPVDAAGLAKAQLQCLTPGLPMVLVVGSHEPRKNHLAVLHAAEVLWREGLAFSVVFVGGNAWNSERFTNRLRELQNDSRAVHSLSAIDDDILWGAYRSARCTVFPSLNEGFGLPIAESLACGTPVITSNFGSMAEIAANGGALLIDPRDDADLTNAMRSMLTDDDLHARLAAEALKVPVRSWDEYAEQTWDYLVAGTPPG